jgi:hypothetical protein
MDQTQATKILGRTLRLPGHQRKVFDRIFNSDGGYVLDFSDRTMSEWFEETCGIKIFQERFQRDGTSKAKTLRCFIEVAEARLVARVIRDLWSYREFRQLGGSDPEQEKRFGEWIAQFISELESASSIPLDDAIRNFSGDTTLAKLNAAIAEDLINEKPDVALDRVHTYCVKRLRYILATKGQQFDANAPLDALFGAYSRLLKEQERVSEFALPALRAQYKLFEGLNLARNKRSFAHDNELLDFSEAKFVIDSTLVSLAFIERLEAASALPPAS